MKQLIDYFYIGFSFLANKKIIAVLEICLFISLLQISIGYKEVLYRQEQEMFEEKKDINVQYYNTNQEVNQNIGNQTAIEELVHCYQSSVDLASLNEEVKKYINQLQQLYKMDSEYFSFLYQDLYSGFTVSYNETGSIFTASTIKAPAMIYLYEMASEGKINLEEKLVYTSRFYHGGSGVLQTKPVNTEYSVGQLIYYAIHDSDNIAYAMLMDRFGRKNVLEFWKRQGTQNIYTLNTIWGFTSAKDASIYMKELYRFYQKNHEYGKRLIEYFKGATWKLIVDKNGEFNTANKGGWSGKAIHDVAIVFDKNPYLLVIMSNKGEGGYEYLFSETSGLAGELHEAYWKYKSELCQTITQY